MSTSGVKEFAASIRKTRKSLGFTQEEVAEMLDMSTRNYQYIENGKTPVSFAKHADIVKALLKAHNKKDGLRVDGTEMAEAIAEEVKSVYVKVLKWLQ